LDSVLDTVIEGDFLTESARLPDAMLDLIVTSPPYYNVREEYASWTSYASYLESMEAWLAACFRLLKPGRRLVWNVDDLLKSKEFRNCTVSADSCILAKKVGFTVKTKVVWRDTMNAEGWLPGTYPHGPSVVINWCLEDVWVFQKPNPDPKPHLNHSRYPKLPPELAKYDVMDKEFLIKYARNPVWDIRSESALRVGHPAPFPEELTIPPIRMWSRPGEVVGDPFMGSGTTARAALKWRRHFLGFERKREYIQLARRRIERRRIELLMDQLYLPNFAPQVEAESSVVYNQEQIQLDLMAA
jgi:site-specific DNA-methyltransferase (adenine-specific)